MILGNLPQTRAEAVAGKTYWRVAIGRNVMATRFFDDGWYAFEATVFKPYNHSWPGSPLPHRCRIAFAFWLPFYPL